MIAENAWILEDGESPADYRNLGLALLFVLGGLGAIGVSGILLTRHLKVRHSN